MIYELHKTRLHVLNFAVAKEYRRHGVGRQMIAKLTGKLSQQRRSRLLLEVRETNLEAQLFFRSLGFRAVSVLRGFYEDTPEDAYVMQYRISHDRDAGRGAVQPNDATRGMKSIRISHSERDAGHIERGQVDNGERMGRGAIQSAWIDHDRLLFAAFLTHVRVTAANQVPGTAADRGAQPLQIVAMQKRDPPPPQRQLAKVAVVGLPCGDNGLLDFVDPFVDISEHEMRWPGGK